MARSVAVIAIALLAVGLGTIQLASYALDAGAAARGTLPTRVPLSFGVAVYRALESIAPAPYVLATLATLDLERGDAVAAVHEAVKLPASPIRDELLGRIALARGDRDLALEYFLAAPDVAAVDEAVETRAVRSPAEGYALEHLLKVRMVLLGTHPDDVAEASFRLGQLANRQAWREVPDSPRQGAWLERGMRDFLGAVALAPLSEKYLIAAANQAMLLGDLDRSQSLFARAVDADPSSANAIAGLGVVAYQRGDLDLARRDLERARRIDPRALMVLSLERFFAGQRP